MARPHPDPAARPEPDLSPAGRHHGFTNAIVRKFLESNLSLVLMLLAGTLVTPAFRLVPKVADNPPVALSWML